MEIKGYELEFFPEEHTYLVDGIMVPSITEILKVRFGGKYAHVSESVLNKAAEAGTAVHEAIEAYIKTGKESELEEVQNFKFLQNAYQFEVVGSEIPVILFDMVDIPIAAGRLDLVLKIGDALGGADIKRTAVLDKDYLYYQLNLYRIAYKQSYGEEWQFLRGIHLRGEKRKFVPIPINETDAWGIVQEYFDKEGT